MRSDELSKTVVADFSQGFNCAESVLLGLVEAFDLERHCAPRVATAFGAGMARHGEVCGALTGAAMALGLLRGRDTADDVAAKDALYKVVDQLLQAFQERFGSVRCRDLTGCDLLTPEGAEKFRSENIHSEVCSRFVAFTAEEAFRIAKA